ncbi:MAG TPA: hypothetical protein VNK51_24755 [Bradyrhizobium sp.]|nr:hypothetical protein [Bradyrhizobium sp.]
MTKEYPIGGLLNFLDPKPAPPTEEEYFAAVGKLITGYAAAEQAVHTLARRLSKLTDAKARIIFGGLRIADLAERIRGLLRLSKASQKRISDIEACLSQLDRISEQRNRLAHRWVHYFDGRLVCSNVANAKTITATEVVFFELSQLEAMNSDCIAISYRLVQIGVKGGSKNTIKWVREPWRYIPAPPAPRQKRQKDPKSRQRQRLSSRQRREAALARKNQQ